MGGSSWSDDYYRDREEERKKTGKSAFVHDSYMSSVPVSERKVHEKMDPKGVTRESCDSDAHPDSLPVAVMFDHTGSMGAIPMVLQKKLSQLMGLIIRKGYAAHPQVLFGSIGDTCDSGSIQVGQFESGIEMDDDLGRLWLVGGGGGGMQESYQNALYFFARHTKLDSLNKRDKRGYLFLIGDEWPYPKVLAHEVRDLFGDSIQRDIPIEEIIMEARKLYNIFFIIPRGASHGRSLELENRWKALLGGQNVLILEQPEGVCESIATAIGLCEGAVDLDGATRDLRDTGASTAVVKAVEDALGPLAKSVALAKVGTGDLPGSSSKSSKVSRL